MIFTAAALLKKSDPAVMLRKIKWNALVRYQVCVVVVYYKGLPVNTDMCFTIDLIQFTYKDQKISNNNNLTFLIGHIAVFLDLGRAKFVTD